MAVCELAIDRIYIYRLQDMGYGDGNVEFVIGDDDIIPRRWYLSRIHVFCFALSASATFCFFFFFSSVVCFSPGRG